MCTSFERAASQPKTGLSLHMPADSETCLISDVYSPTVDFGSDFERLVMNCLKGKMKQEQASAPPPTIEASEGAMQAGTSENNQVIENKAKCKSEQERTLSYQEEESNPTQLAKSSPDIHVHSENNHVHSENNHVHSENSQVHSENSQVHSENSQVHSENNHVHSENSQVHSENNHVHSENSQVHSENNQVNSENNQVNSENNQVNSENNQANKHEEEIKVDTIQNEITEEENYLQTINWPTLDVDKKYNSSNNVPKSSKKKKERLKKKSKWKNATKDLSSFQLSFTGYIPMIDDEMVDEINREWEKYSQSFECSEALNCEEKDNVTKVCTDNDFDDTITEKPAKLERNSENDGVNTDEPVKGEHEEHIRKSDNKDDNPNEQAISKDNVTSKRKNSIQSSEAQNEKKQVDYSVFCDKILNGYDYFKYDFESLCFESHDLKHQKISYEENYLSSKVFNYLEPCRGLRTNKRLWKRKHKWKIQKAHKQIKTKHCKSLRNCTKGKKLYVNHRVKKQMDLEAQRLCFMPSPRSIARIEKAQIGATSSIAAQRAAQNRHYPTAPRNPNHTLTAYNADHDLDARLVNLLITMQDRDLTPEDYELLLQLDERVAPKTVAEEKLMSFKTDTVTESEVDLMCSICMEHYTLGEIKKHLPCGHFFHSPCIDNWLQNSSMNCPLDGLALE